MNLTRISRNLWREGSFKRSSKRCFQWSIFFVFLSENLTRVARRTVENLQTNRADFGERLADIFVNYLLETLVMNPKDDFGVSDADSFKESQRISKRISQICLSRNTDGTREQIIVSVGIRKAQFHRMNIGRSRGGRAREEEEIWIIHWWKRSPTSLQQLMLRKILTDNSK